jgi:hypothetical protein
MVARGGGVQKLEEREQQLEEAEEALKVCHMVSLLMSSVMAIT